MGSGDNHDKLSNVQWQKNILFGLADFFHDYEHPSYRRQAALVQECIDKRKEQLQSEAFLHAIEALTEKYKGDQTSPKFDKELRALRLQYAPNLAAMDKEVQESQKTLGMPDSFE